MISRRRGLAQPSKLALQQGLLALLAGDAQKSIAILEPALTATVVKTFWGNLGLDSGIPQSVYKLEGLGKTLFPMGKAQGLQVGQTLTLPNGKMLFLGSSGTGAPNELTPENQKK